MNDKIDPAALHDQITHTKIEWNRLRDCKMFMINLGNLQKNSREYEGNITLSY